MLTISAGHFGKGTGASGFLDEGEESVYVVQRLSEKLRHKGITVNTVIDKQSKNQQQNLAYLINQHNATQRELDVSIHFNAAPSQRKEGIGTEVLYINPAIYSFAIKMSTEIAKAGKFKNRGAKQRFNLAFLNGTNRKSIIIEVCFVNSEQDAMLYQKNKGLIIEAIAHTFTSYFPHTAAVCQTPAQQTITSKALHHKVEELFNDKNAVRRQLEKGVQKGTFQPVWLENFELGKLTLYDYIALTTLQYQKNNSKM